MAQSAGSAVFERTRRKGSVYLHQRLERVGRGRLSRAMSKWGHGYLEAVKRALEDPEPIVVHAERSGERDEGRQASSIAPSVSVVVWADEDPPVLDRCMRALAEQTLSPTRYEAVFVDAVRAVDWQPVSTIHEHGRRWFELPIRQDRKRWACKSCQFRLAQYLRGYRSYSLPMTSFRRSRSLKPIGDFTRSIRTCTSLVLAAASFQRQRAARNSVDGWRIAVSFSAYRLRVALRCSRATISIWPTVRSSASSWGAPVCLTKRSRSRLATITRWVFDWQLKGCIRST